MNELLSTDPTVVMNVELGKKLPEGQVLDVNYNALRTALDTVDAPEDNSHLTIVVEAKFPSNGEFSYYENEEQGQRISVRYDWRGITGLQESLQHEAQHYSDLSHDRLKRSTLRKIGTVAARHTPATAALGVGALITGYGTLLGASDMGPVHQEMIELAAGGAMISGLAAPLAIASVSMLYSLDPHERRAQKAEKLDLPQVFSLHHPEN